MKVRANRSGISTTGAQPSELVKTTPEIQRLGPASGDAALTRKRPRRSVTAPSKIWPQRASARSRSCFPRTPVRFCGILAEIWEWDYVERLVGGKPLIAASTKGKYRNPLHNHYSAALGGNHRLISTLHGLPSKPARTFLPSLFFSLSQPYQMPPQRAKPKPDAV